MDSSADSVEPSYQSDRSSKATRASRGTLGGDDRSGTPVGTTTQTLRTARLGYKMSRCAWRSPTPLTDPVRSAAGPHASSFTSAGPGCAA